MGNVARAFRAGLVSAGLAVLVSIAVSWEAPEAIVPMAVALGFMFVGVGVSLAPGYDESGPFPRRWRKRFGNACAICSILSVIGILVWIVLSYHSD